MTDQTPAAPERGVVPYLNLLGASDASAFYQRAFGATELLRMPAKDGRRLLHCHLHINGGSLMISDCFPEQGHPHQPSSSFTMHLSVDDVDAAWNQAVEAGCEVTLPLQLMFWGDRYGMLRDPFGVCWSISSPGAAA
jgi:PhnB protein